MRPCRKWDIAMRSLSMRNSAWRVAAVLTLFLFTACGGSAPGSPSPQALSQSLPQTITTAHFVFHYQSGDSVDSARQEQYYAWAAATLGIDPAQKVDYYKYLDRSRMQAITGRDTNGWADPPVFAVHTIWTWDNHETVHVYTALIGRPSDYFNEGIAVAMETDPANHDLVPRWSNTPLHTLAKGFMQTNRLSFVQDVDDTDTFRKLDESVSYPMAGSFVEFLIERYGMAKVKDFFRASTRDDSRSTINTKFQQAFGVSVADADQAWRTFLATQ